MEGRFKRIDADAFTATAYRDGRRKSFCHVFMSQAPNGIAYSASERLARGGFNESLSVDADENGVHLRPISMALHGSDKGRLTTETAAEAYWTLFIDGMRH